MITLLKDIKVDLNRYIMFMNGKIQYSKDVNAQINIKFRIPIAFTGWLQTIPHNLKDTLNILVGDYHMCTKVHHT